MINLVLIFSLIILAFSIISCKEEDFPDENQSLDPPEFPSGNAESFTNGALWGYDVYVSQRPDFPGKFVLGFNYINENGYKRGTLSIKNITKKIGEFYPEQWTYVQGAVDTVLSFSFYTSLGDGDVAGDQYILLEDSSMVFTLDKIDPSGEIWGTFSGTLLKKIGEMEYDPASPDTLVFTDGKYHAKLDL